MHETSTTLATKVLAELRAGRKMEAVNLLRQTEGMGLKAAAALLQKMAHAAPLPGAAGDKNRAMQGAPLNPLPVPTKPAARGFAPQRVPLPAEAPNRQEAIRRVCHATGLSAADAAHVLDNRALRPDQLASNRSPGEVAPSGSRWTWAIVVAVLLAGLAHWLVTTA